MLRLFYLSIFFVISTSYGQWTKCPTVVSERLVSIFADSTGLVLVGGIDGTLLKSNNFGQTLRIVKTDIKHTFEQFIKVNDSLYLARIGNDGGNIGWKMYYSTDQGETWIDNLSPSFHFRGLQIVNGKLYIGPWNYNGSPNQIYRSVDNGKTWKFLSNINTTLLTDNPLIIDDSNWYVGGSDGLIMFTSDAGNTWEKQARGMTTAGLGGCIKVKDTVVVTNGTNIWAGYFKKDTWSNTYEDPWYPGGTISYSGKYWWRSSQRGTDYSSSVFKWEKGRCDVGFSRFFWVDTVGNGYAISGNNLYRTNNHGIMITSVSDEEDVSVISETEDYFNLLGQQVLPTNNQLLFKFDKKRGIFSKLIYIEK